MEYGKREREEGRKSGMEIKYGYVLLTGSESILFKRRKEEGEGVRKKCMAKGRKVCNVRGWKRESGNEVSC